MSTLLETIQQIALKAVRASNPMSFLYGKVTAVNPLKILCGDNGLEVSEDFLILCEPVIEKKLTIKKHTHSVGSTVSGHYHAFSAAGAPVNCPYTGLPHSATGSSSLNSSDTVDNTVLDAYCQEFKMDDEHKLPAEPDEDKIVVTINKALEVGEKVIMLKVCSGQEFIVFSRMYDLGHEG
jgi:hypothetical protein